MTRFEDYKKAVNDFLIAGHQDVLSKAGDRGSDENRVTALMFNMICNFMVDEGIVNEDYDFLSKEGLANSVVYLSQNRNKIMDCLLSDAAIYLFSVPLPEDDDEQDWDEDFVESAKKVMHVPPHIVAEADCHDSPHGKKSALMTTMIVRALYEIALIGQTKMENPDLIDAVLWSRGLAEVTKRVIKDRLNRGEPLYRKPSLH